MTPNCFCWWLLWAACQAIRPTETNTLPLPQANYPTHVVAPAPPPAACLSGVINIYTPVFGFGCDSSALSVGSTNGFAAGDKVLLIQMQVPQVDLSNTAAFGTLLNTTAIGNYEFNRILSISGNQVQLQYLLTRAYDLSGKVQLVRVPEYDTAMVCNLSCQPWNGSTGGVLAMDVKTTLTLSGDVDVSAKGFRGGFVEPNYIAWVFGETQYFYPPQSTLAAQKGEGIVSIPTDYSYGRGRAGNGGGGGNAHNGGGGGGGNAGLGGQGGLEISNLPASPTPNTNGIGGMQYFVGQADKLLLGGGGGAGHANDALGSSGGNGGGIVFLSSKTLQTNGYHIRANGQDIPGGFNHNDGQGGGGGGGSIVLQFNQISGPLFCDLKGGIGGSNPYIPDFQIHGPGGGGGGGKLVLTQNVAALFANVQGGQNGLTSQNLTNDAQPGSGGIVLTSANIPQGLVLAHPVSNIFTVAGQNPHCVGQTDGQISVVQSGALTFNLNGGPWQSNPVFSGLGAGTYLVGLRFSGGCTLDTTLTLVDPPPVQVSLLSLTNQNCQTGGSISIAATAGVAPFSYQLDNISWQNSGDFQNLAPGLHTVRVKDANGCLVVTQYNITAYPFPAPPTLSAQFNCDATGQIQVQSSTAIAFQISGGNWQNSPVFNNLNAGNYPVSLQYPDGCTFDTTFSLQTIPVLQDSLLSLQGASCAAGGQIQLGALGGTAPYFYQIDAGPGQNSGFFNNITPGSHLFKITDAAGCMYPVSYIIPPPTALSDTILNVQAASCAQGGSVQIAGLLGTAPYQYQLDGGAFQNSGLFSNLPAGAHTYLVLDAGGCTQQNNFSINPPPPVSDTLLTIEAATCLTGGSLSIAGIAGTPPYQFQLDGGAFQNNGNFSNLAAGVHSGLIRDAGGCTHLFNYSVAAATPVTDSLIALVGASCLSGGQLTITGISGTAPYQFQVDGGALQSNGTFSNLSPGPHLVQVTDAAGCKHQNNYQIAPPVPVADTLLQLTHANCAVGGSITVAGIAGTAPYQYQLDGNNLQNNGSFSGLSPGNHVLQITDAAGCTHSSTYLIGNPTPVQISLLSQTAASCADGGTLTVTGQSGTPPFQYQIDGGAWQNSGVFIDIPIGLHQLSVLDAGGCTVSATYAVAPPPIPAAPGFVVTPGCKNDGQIMVQQAAALSFSLNGGPWQSSSLFQNLAPGNYQIGLLFAGDCTLDTMVSMPALAPVLDSLVLKTDENCFEKGTLQVAAISGKAPFQFQIDGNNWQSSGFFQQLAPGKHLLVLRDAWGCVDSSFYTIAPLSPLLVQIDSLRGIKCGAEDGVVWASAQGGDAPYTFRLGGQNAQTTGNFHDLAAGVYALRVTDSRGCTAEIGAQIPSLADSVLTIQFDTIYQGRFYTLPDGRKTNQAGQYPFLYQTTEGCDSLLLLNLAVLPRNIYIPNIFHPDYDGINEYFTVFGDRSVARVLRLRVYDRWGELVFERRDFQPNVEPDGWDGRFRGKALDMGVFVWVVELEFVDGEVWNLWGDVTLLR